MATYGPNSGKVPFTGFTPTLGESDAITPAVSGSAQFNGLTQNDGKLAALLRRNANRKWMRNLLTLIGATAGSTATENRAQVKGIAAAGDPETGGGLVDIETVALINRATTAADVTNLKAVFNRTPAPTSYPADVAGVGGGGKVGF